MNKTELINAVAELTDLSKQECEKAVHATLEAISNALAKGEPVKISGFGAFETKERPARTVRNPRTGEEMTVPASRAVTFKAGKKLKDTVSKA